MDVGTWTDLGLVVASDRSKSYNAIDGNLVVVDDRRFLSFGSFWNGLYQVPLNSPPTEVLLDAQAYQLSYDRTDIAQEAPVVFKDGNFYYLFLSKGSCCGYDRNKPANGTEYRIAVCRSALPTGGFVDRAGVLCTNGGGTIILGSHNWVYGPGGQGVYRDPKNGPVSNISVRIMVKISTKAQIDYLLSLRGYPRGLC